MRRLILVLMVAFPSRIRIALYRSLFGWKIGRGTRIGFSYIDARVVEIGENVRIRHLNIFRELRELRIGSDSYISNSNQIFGSGEFYADFPCRVSIGRSVMFMSRHFIDGTGAVEICDGVTLAGRDTHMWSHTLKMVDGKPQLVPTAVVVGAGAYVGARATLLACRVPAGAFVGAGSIVNKCFPDGEARVLIAGNPAKVVKTYKADERVPHSTA